MSYWAKQFRMSPGEHGTNVFEETGLCHQGDVPNVLANCTKRFNLVPFPNARGVVMKVLDGTVPALVQLTPPNPGTVTFLVVKVGAIFTPYSAAHPGGLSQNQHICLYAITWQEVGAIA